MTSQIAPLQLTNKNSGCKPMLNQEVRHQTRLASKAATVVVCPIQPAHSAACAGRCHPGMSKQASLQTLGRKPNVLPKYTGCLNIYRPGLFLHAQVAPCDGVQVLWDSLAVGGNAGSWCSWQCFPLIWTEPGFGGAAASLSTQMLLPRWLPCIEWF